MKKKRIIGIVLLVIGILALIGGFANGSFANLKNENIITAATEIILQIGFLAGGIGLIAASFKNKD
ncbi:MAG: hypothetical protein ACI4IE_02430 [Eubacterium sp.]